MPVVPLVLVAALLHATWNALVKSVDDRLSVLALIGATSVLVCLPIAVVAPAPRGAALPFLAGSVAVHGIYTLLLIGCYRHGDFNQVYPVARGLAPPTVAVSAAVLVCERIGGAQAVGLVVLTVGMLVIALGRGRASRRGLTFAGLTGLAIAAYTVLDGIGVRHSGSALGYTGWLFVAEGLILPAVWLVRRGGGSVRQLPRGLLVRGAGAGVLSVIAYGLVLWAQTRGALAVVAALRETSVVFGALIGAAMFRERLPSRRVLASALIAAGAVLLAAD
ncbi:MAG: EamA family transporter [Solirubrobacteraceae bacterium]